MTTLGVVALQGAVGEHLAMLTALGVTARTVRTPAELEGLDGLVLPGGESTAMARAAAKVELFARIRQLRQDGLAILGTCAGLVLLAERVADAGALAGFATVGGLDVTARRNAFGGQLSSFTTHLEVAGLEGPAFGAVFIRAPQVLDPAPQVEVLARTVPDGPVVAVRQGRLLATSFHPELTLDDRIHRLFVETCVS